MIKYFFNVGKAMHAKLWMFPSGEVGVAMQPFSVYEEIDRLKAFYLQRYLCYGSIRNPYLWLALLVSQVVYWSILASTGSTVLAFIIYVISLWWMLTHVTDAWAGDIIEKNGP